MPMLSGITAINEKKQELEKIQIEAARIVTGATKLVSIETLYNDVCWEPLESRRRKHKLVLLYKMYNNLTPFYLSPLVPPMVQHTTRYNLRNAGDLQTIYSRSSLYSKIPILRPHLGLSKSGLKDHFWTVPKVVSNQRYTGCKK